MTNSSDALRGVKTALVAIPWAMARRPCAALGVLKSYVRRERPQDLVECIYAYPKVARQCGDTYRVVAEDETNWGTLLWGTLLYPESTDRMRVAWRAALPEHADKFDLVRDALDRCLDEIVAARDWNGWVIGLTTGFGQIFGNIELARRIKAVAPNAIIVLGGSTANGAVGRSLIREFDALDYVIQGEGERPLVALLDGLAEDWHEPAIGDATLCKRNIDAEVRMSQVKDLDELPTPDYDEFFSDPAVRGQRLALPVEGSRGCWWDRTAKDAKSICAFCNLNTQWRGYRQKSAQRLAAEVRELSNEYRLAEIAFTDNIVRSRGFEALISEIDELEADLSFFYEARAHMKPAQLLAMWNIGLRGVQFGIEALSTSLLERINKGTSTIQNLQAIKTACELNVTHVGNLIINFPGSTQAEVDDTLAVLDLVEGVYEPLLISDFVLGVDSYVHREPARFGVSNIRNSNWYGAVVPADVLDRLAMPTHSFDRAPGAADWTPVVERVKRWTDKGALSYVEGPDFVKITDRRPGRAARYELHGWMAELYIYCTEIRHRRDILARFADEADPEELEDALEDFLEAGLMFSESDRFLSLAVAPSPERAARRIRRLQGEQKPTPTRTRLTVLATQTPCAASA